MDTEANFGKCRTLHHRRIKIFEEQILGAEGKIQILEEKIFGQLLLAVNEYLIPIQLNAQLLAKLDVLIGFHQLAQNNHYVRPVIDESFILHLEGARHPVIEKRLAAGEQYVPNDLYLDSDTQQILMITGPNMAGKSALLRQQH